MNKLFIVLLSLSIIACDGQREPDPVGVSKQSINDAQLALVNDLILPNVHDFLNKSTLFKTSVNSFCNDKTSVRLTDAQDAFKALSTSWYGIELFAFGPIDDNLFSPKIGLVNKYYYEHKEFQSTNRGYVTSNLATTTGINFSSVGRRKRGLFMLETLLFETADSTHSQDNALILADYNNAGKCYLLKGFAELMEQDAQYIDDGWNIEHHYNAAATGKPFKEIYLSGQVPDGTQSLTKLLKSVQVYLDYTSHRQVMAKTGLLSKNNYANATAFINTVEKVLTGSETIDETKPSFFSIMQVNRASEVATVKSNIALAKQAIIEQDHQTYEGVTTLLDGNFKREISNGLSVNLGLNFSDGD